MKMIPENYMIADSVEVIVGTTSSTVSDLQTRYDGNNYHIDEDNVTPGIDLRVNFVNILRFSQILYTAYYNGRATHYVEFQMYNYTTGIWEIYDTIEVSFGMASKQFDVTDFIHHIKKGVVLTKFYHPLMGIAPDDLFIDYVALIR